MNIICASICYRGYAEDEVAATLENAPKIGYKLMEIHGPLIWSVGAARLFDLPGIQSRLKAAGLQCAGLYPPGWGGKDDADVQGRAGAIAACVRYADALGATHITTSGASRRTEAGALDRVIACVRQVLEQIPVNSPVKLTLEPHHGNVLEQSEDFERILDEISDLRVGVCIDTGHFHAAGVDTIAAIHRFAPRVYAVHLKDHIGNVSVGIGRGELDLTAVIGALREVDYQGGLTLELEVEDPQNLPRYTEEAYIYLNGMLGQKL
jgi:sugar phosphate isomerase/epimerase